ncbi:MAG TPA: helix-turn-helix domain-containing protein [Nitrococcus sp.]|nr:helix-turn-helix domain-containing protein [Nitrococcus sp.]
MNTIELLDALKERLSATSDYDLSRKMGWSRQRVSKYRSGRDTFGDDTAIHIAEILDFDPGEVLAWMHAERTDSPAVREAWQAIARRLHHGITPLFLLALLLPPWQPPATTHSLYTSDQPGIQKVIRSYAQKACMRLFLSMARFFENLCQVRRFRKFAGYRC